MPVELKAYNLIPGKIFVKVPDQRGRWMITNESVALLPCSVCGAIEGEPCYRRVQDKKSYTCTPHYARDWGMYNLPRSKEPPKLRISLADVDLSDLELRILASRAASKIADDFTPGFVDSRMEESFAETIYGCLAQR